MNELYEILWVGHEYIICSLDHLKSYLAGLNKDTPNSYPELSAYEFGAGLVMLDGDVVARLYENDEMTTNRTSSPAPVWDSRGGSFHVYLKPGYKSKAAYLLEQLTIVDHAENPTLAALICALIDEKIKELKGNEDE